jgi:hypothetical protein
MRGKSRGEGLITFLMVLAALVAAVFIALGQQDAQAAGGGHTPITICHQTGSESNPWVEITVDDDSVNLTAHLAHGDYVGQCQEAPPPPVCPEGFTSAGLSNGVLLCTKETVKEIEVIREVKVEVPVYIEVPGPTVYVDVVREVPVFRDVFVEKVVEKLVTGPTVVVTKVVKSKPIVKTKVVTKVKTVVKTKVKKVPVYGVCKIGGKIAVQGSG